MDKLFDHKSRLGWLSISPITIITLLIVLTLQSFTVYKDVMALSKKYNLDTEFVADMESLLTTHFYVGFSVLGGFGVLLFGVYLFEKRRRSKQNKDLSKNIKNLSILSMIKETSNCVPRDSSRYK